MPLSRSVEGPVQAQAADRRPGQYDVRSVDSNQQSKASASGEAQIRNYVTLEVRVDISAVSRSEYQLALRREGDNWHFYPHHCSVMQRTS